MQKVYPSELQIQREREEELKDMTYPEFLLGQRMLENNAFRTVEKLHRELARPELSPFSTKLASTAFDKVKTEDFCFGVDRKGGQTVKVLRPAHTQKLRKNRGNVEQEMKKEVLIQSRKTGVHTKQAWEELMQNHAIAVESKYKANEMGQEFCPLPKYLLKENFTPFEEESPFVEIQVAGKTPLELRLNEIAKTEVFDVENDPDLEAFVKKRDENEKLQKEKEIEEKLKEDIERGSSTENKSNQSKSFLNGISPVLQAKNRFTSALKKRRNGSDFSETHPTGQPMVKALNRMQTGLLSFTAAMNGELGGVRRGSRRGSRTSNGTFTTFSETAHLENDPSAVQDQEDPLYDPHNHLEEYCLRGCRRAGEDQEVMLGGVENAHLITFVKKPEVKKPEEIQKKKIIEMNPSHLSHAYMW